MVPNGGLGLEQLSQNNSTPRARLNPHSTRKADGTWDGKLLLMKPNMTPQEDVATNMDVTRRVKRRLLTWSLSRFGGWPG